MKIHYDKLHSFLPPAEFYKYLHKYKNSVILPYHSFSKLYNKKPFPYKSLLSYWFHFTITCIIVTEFMPYPHSFART